MDYEVEGLKHKLIEALACRQCLFFISSVTFSERGNLNYFCCIYQQPLSSGMGKPPWCEFKGVVGVFEVRVPIAPEQSSIDREMLLVPGPAGTVPQSDFSPPAQEKENRERNKEVDNRYDEIPNGDIQTKSIPVPHPKPKKAGVKKRKGK